MNKKLNILEVLKMPVGTEFTIGYSNGDTAITHMVLKENDNGRKYLDWADDETLKVFDFLGETMFTPIEASVSFVDVINSEKKCRIEHYLVNNDEYSQNYHELDDLMNVMSEWYTSDELKTVIKEGKWFLEK